MNLKKTIVPNRIYADASNKAVLQDWYTIKALKNAADDVESLDISIYGEIGYWGVSAQDFITELRALDDGKSPITVGINSYGGDVFDGIAIHNTLKRLGDRVTVRVDAVAASAASVIAVGAAKVMMPKNAMMMIHNPWTFAMGEADDLRQTADMMDKVREGLLNCYLNKATNMNKDELVTMMDETTWLTADEAVALGLADIIEDTEAKISATAHDITMLKRLPNAPKALLDSMEAEQEVELDEDAEQETEAEGVEPEQTVQAGTNVVLLMSALEYAGLNNDIKELIAMSKVDLNKEDAVQAEADRIKAVSDLCVLARKPELVKGYVEAGLSANDVRSRLINDLVDDTTQIDNKQTATVKESSQANDDGTNPDKVYAARSGKAKKSTAKEQ